MNPAKGSPSCRLPLQPQLSDARTKTHASRKPWGFSMVSRGVSARKAGVSSPESGQQEKHNPSFQCRNSSKTSYGFAGDQQSLDMKQCFSASPQYRRTPEATMAITSINGWTTLIDPFFAAENSLVGREPWRLISEVYCGTARWQGTLTFCGWSNDGKPREGHKFQWIVIIFRIQITITWILFQILDESKAFSSQNMRWRPTLFGGLQLLMFERFQQSKIVMMTDLRFGNSMANREDI